MSEHDEWRQEMLDRIAYHGSDYDAQRILSLLEAVTAAIHLKRHPAHHHHCRCEEFAHAALDAIRVDVPESVEVVRGWRYCNDGSASPVERWVRHADGDWVSLDSTRRTSGDIHVIPHPAGTFPPPPRADRRNRVFDALDEHLNNGCTDSRCDFALNPNGGPHFDALMIAHLVEVVRGAP